MQYIHAALYSMCYYLSKEALDVALAIINKFVLEGRGSEQDVVWSNTGLTRVDQFSPHDPFGSYLQIGIIGNNNRA